MLVRTPSSVLFSLFIALTIFANPAAAAILHPHAPGELIVRFEESTSSVQQHAVHDALGAEFIRAIAGGMWHLVRFDSAVDLEDRQAAYEGLPSVEYAHPNHLGEGGFTPNDTHFGVQWQHNNLGQSGGTVGADLESVAGWDLARGSSGIVVAILDTGIDSDHPEFAGRIVAGYDFVNADADPEDDNGHGTWCAGNLAANADNNHSVAGVDHFCDIMPVKVLDAFNSGFTTDLIDGIIFASTNGAHVISMSLINFPGNQALRSAITVARNNGTILVACAGNGGIGDADISWPGASAVRLSRPASTLSGSNRAGKARFERSRSSVRISASDRKLSGAVPQGEGGESGSRSVWAC